MDLLHALYSKRSYFSSSNHPFLMNTVNRARIEFISLCNCHSKMNSFRLFTSITCMYYDKLALLNHVRQIHIHPVSKLTRRKKSQPNKKPTKNVKLIEKHG